MKEEEKKTRNCAIVHFNTPELTEALILSIRKHGGEDYKITIFDNSDKRPWKKRMKGVHRIDNTQGQIINFDEELEKYPDRDEKVGCSFGCWFGSDKHAMTVQKLWELIPEGFLLIDSDMLIKKNIDFMFDESKCAIGMVGYSAGPHHLRRLLPMLLYINVPKCVAGGARFFDPERSWALHQGRSPQNWWDTGAVLYDDIRRLKPQCTGRDIDIRPLALHYGSGSWFRSDLNNQLAWISQHEELWK